MNPSRGRALNFALLGLSLVVLAVAALWTPSREAELTPDQLKKFAAIAAASASAHELAETRTREAARAHGQVPLAPTDTVSVSAALMDFSRLEAEDRELARARLWQIRRIDWGWERLRDIVESVAAEHKAAAFWLTLSDGDRDVAVIAAFEGRATAAPISALAAQADALARTPAERRHVREVLGDAKADAAAASALEIDGDARVAAPLPSVEILRTKELMKGWSFSQFRVEGSYYLPRGLSAQITKRAFDEDGSWSRVFHQCYERSRERLQRVAARAELAPAASTRTPDGGGDRESVFLVMSSWVAFELDRKAAELDSSKSRLVSAVFEWCGLPGR